MLSSSAFVSVDWLREHLGEPTIRVLDGSWYLPALQRDTRHEFHNAHIPGARYFDIDAITQDGTTLPHMLPSAPTFSEVLRSLAIAPDNIVVVYDSAGLLSAARVWWTLRVYGHNNVVILKGGLPAWREAQLPVVSEGPSERSSERSSNRFEAAQAVWQRAYYARCDDVYRAATEGTSQIIDARSGGRFSGRDPEPRKDLPSGHIPESINVPYTTLVDAERGCLHETTTLKQLFETAGADLAQPIITSCGSGITACILAVALYELGVDPVGVFDGSWTEWASTPGLPIGNHNNTHNTTDNTAHHGKPNPS